MIIGLSGKKQSGKSTLARHLVTNHNFREVSWAMPLKEIIGRQLFGFTLDQVYDDIEKEKVVPEWGMSPRQVLQIVGTDCFRKNICDDFWIKLGIKRICEIKEFDPNISIVVSDCRFINEIKAIVNLGGYTVRTKRLGQTYTDLHLSETELDNFQGFDATIPAFSGDIEKLKRDIDAFVQARE
jgi:hypothetical protein